MSELLTTSNITFALGILAVIFSVFLFFRKPQEETETKAALLAQQVVLERDMNEKKFVEFGKRLDDAFALAQNHTHSVSVQVEGLTTLVNSMNLSMTENITKLYTIIHERIPRK